MATDFDAFPFMQELTQTTWMDEAYTNATSFPQDLQAIEDHLFNFETDPLFSLPRQDSSFFLDLCDFDAIQPPQPEPMITEECAEADVCEAFLNDYEFSQPGGSPNSNDENMYNPTEIPTVSNQSDTETVHPVFTGSNTMDDLTATPGQQEDNDNEEEEVEEADDDPKRGTLNCKNLVSERNRRKRLSQQLLALRALVPNITKMDKRSVLVDALSYLRNIHEETAKVQKELKEQQKHPKLNQLKESNQDNPVGTLRLPRSTLPSPVTSKPKPRIIEIDTERIEEKRFIVKITCKGAGSVGGDILRVFESLDFEITNTSLQQLKPQEMLVTTFIRVRKQGKMTEEKLKDCITSMALRSGIKLQNP